MCVENLKQFQAHNEFHISVSYELLMIGKISEDESYGEKNRA